MAAGSAGPRYRLRAPVRRVAVRFAEVACPPQVRSGDRIERLLAEFELFLGVLPPAARHGVAAALLVFDRGARLYPRSGGRRFARLDDRAADAFLGALLGRRGSLGGIARRIKGLILMCYYELPDVQEELGYRPEPYMAAVARRRLASYGAEIRAGEAAVLAPGPMPQGQREER